MFDEFPKKVFHLRKRQKAYTYDLKIEIDARAARVASKKPSKREVEKEVKRLRAELAKKGWREAIHPWTGKPFLDVVDDYFSDAVERLKQLKNAA